LACCGRLADKGIGQNAFSIGIHASPDSISGLREYFFELQESRTTRAWGLEDNLSRMQQLGYFDQDVSA
jgi:hypothetical protein